MRRLVLLATAVAAVALPASAQAAPDAVRCTTELAIAVALYDGPIESYPHYAAGAGTGYANCVA